MDSSTLKKLGIKIGHYTDKKNLTGTTAFIAEQGADIGIDIRGSNTGTLNTPAFEPKAAGKIVHGVVLTGGSTFGLESAFGVMQYLEKKNFGNMTRAGIIPGMTGAVIYDIAVGTKTIPSKQNGYDAASNASFDNLTQGNIGVGTGATTGKWFKGNKIKGGFGYGLSVIKEDILVGAFAVTNSIGNIINPRTNKFDVDFETEHLLDGKNTENLAGLIEIVSQNTTLVLIATNVALHKTQLMKVSEIAHDGMARAVYPVHTNLDGDVVFAVSSHSGERKKLKIDESALVDLIGMAAANATMEAIKNSILNAESIEGFTCFKEIGKE